ncbi:MAG: sortase [Oscillospiraceae bacterium]|nr:sortase [Oscillospiraceae bacterium]
MKNKTRKWSWGNLLTLSGVILIIGAILLVGYNLWDQKRAEMTAETALISVQSAIDNKTVTEISAEELPENDEEAETVPEGQSVEAAAPVIFLDGLEYVGILNVPDLNLELPILNYSSVDNLKIAPCRYDGSAEGGDLILSAHNYRRHFGRISQLSIGAEVVFTDMEGKQYTYEVTAFESLEPDQVQQMKEGDWDLTMYTCNLDQSRRTTVRCKLITAE